MMTHHGEKEQGSTLSQYEEILLTLPSLLEGSSPQEDLKVEEAKERIQDIRQDRDEKKKYANLWFWTVAAQLAIIYGLFFVWIWKSALDVWTVRVFFGVTILQTFGVVLVITQHLFPRR